jgi:hypothetical protein
MNRGSGEERGDERVCAPAFRREMIDPVAIVAKITTLPSGSVDGESLWE